MGLEFWNSKVYTVAKMIPDLNGIHTTLTNNVKYDQVSVYSILANFIGTSWNLKINNSDELSQRIQQPQMIWLQQLYL